MTTSDIQAMLVTADSSIRHHFSMGTGSDYSYWEETERLPLTGDDGHMTGWRFYVHRFTKSESDTVADTLFNLLDGDPRTTVQHSKAYEPETGYIHHIFRCEGY